MRATPFHLSEVSLYGYERPPSSVRPQRADPQEHVLSSGQRLLGRVRLILLYQNHDHLPQTRILRIPFFLPTEVPLPPSTALYVRCRTHPRGFSVFRLSVGSHLWACDVYPPSFHRWVPFGVHRVGYLGSFLIRGRHRYRARLQHRSYPTMEYHFGYEMRGNRYR